MLKYKKNEKIQAPQSVTDWNAYYENPICTAAISRRITTTKLLNTMKQHTTARPMIAELGGADSSFFHQIYNIVRPKQYHIIDTNQLGLKRFQERHGNMDNVYLHYQDVLTCEMVEQFDLVFSVGLIEHFDVSDTRKAIAAHFRLAKPGGIVLMTFPTPTWLYRYTRWIVGTFGVWRFHDERPLRFEEVAMGATPFGLLLEKFIIWPIFLTQYLTVWEKGAVDAFI